jgi:histone H4
MSSRGKKSTAGAKGVDKKPKRAIKARVGISDLLEGITKPSLRKLARRAGIKRISSTFYPAGRNLLNHNLTELLYNAITFAGCADRKTIQRDDILNAALTLKRVLVGVASK